VAGGDAATGAPGVQLRSYKILGDGCNGCGALLSNIVQAINDGIADGLHIMNHSWSIPRGVYSTIVTSAGHEDYRYFDEAIRLAHAAKIVTVAASGNRIDQGNNYLPAHTYDPWVLTVAATGFNGEWLNEYNPNNPRPDAYSTPNDNVDVAAPGTATLVYSTTNTGGYMGVSGTSVAAPHVTGLAALMMSYWNDPGNPQNDLTPEDVENIMQNSATDKTASPSSVGEDDYTGRGLINATKTLNNIKKPANALLRHRITTGPADVALVGTRTGVYISGGPANLFLFPGFYDLEVYEITGIGPSDYSPDATLRGRWVQTSTTNLRGPLGPPVTVTKRDGVTTVTSQASLKNENGAVYAGLAGKANAQFKGYAYRLTSMYDIEAGTSQPYTRWIPFDPYAANRPGRIDYTNHWSSNILFARNAAGSQSAASAYPNPAKEELSILLPQAETGAATVDVLSLTGQAMRREARQLKGEQLLRVPVAALRPGLYFYRVQTPTGVFQGKFTKAE
jgi:Subtilase family/Secretion system C-terminal sorting domain